MELSERFMRVSASGVSRVEPSIELDGSWEVGILDTYLNIPNDDSEEKGHHGGGAVEKTYGREFLCDGPMDFTMRYEVKQDGLVNEGARKAWINYKYGNNAKNTQSSQFDIWGMKINEEQRKLTAQTVSNYFKDVYFKNNPDKRLTIHEIITILNENMKRGGFVEAVPFLGAVFAKTGGEKHIVRPPYFSLPSLSIVNGLVTMHVPFYVREVYFRPNLRKILNFRAIKSHPELHIDSIFKRGMYHVHSPLTGSNYMPSDSGGVLYQFYRESYIIRDPTTTIHSVVKTGDKSHEIERNALRILAPDLIESKPTGNHSEPWLRIIERKGGYVQYANPIYCDLKYNRLTRIGLRLVKPNGKYEILKGGWLTLHFRRKIKHE